MSFDEFKPCKKSRENIKEGTVPEVVALTDGWFSWGQMVAGFV